MSEALVRSTRVSSAYITAYQHLNIKPNLPFKPQIKPFSTGIVFRRQSLTSADVRLWRLKTIPALKEIAYL